MTRDSIDAARTRRSSRWRSVRGPGSRCVRATAMWSGRSRGRPCSRASGRRRTSPCSTRWPPQRRATCSYAPPSPSRMIPPASSERNWNEREVLVRRATMLAQLAQELSSVNTVAQVAQVVTTTGRDVLGATFANIAVVDAHRRHLDIVHSPPLPPDMAAQYGQRRTLRRPPPRARWHAARPSWCPTSQVSGTATHTSSATRSQPVWSRPHRCRCSTPTVRWPARSVSAGARQPSSRQRSVLR